MANNDDVWGNQGPQSNSKQEGIGWGNALGAIGPIAGAVYSMFGPSRKQLQEEQIEQQKKLTRIQADTNKEQASFTAGLQKEMWDQTQVDAQMEHVKNAGLNPGLFYGMGGGGGGTTGNASAGSVGGSSASDPTAIRQNELGMGMQIAQLGMMQAQTEKTKAETENIKAGTEKTGIDTATGKLNLDTATKTQQATIQTIQETAAKALADAVQSQQKQVITEETMKDQIKTIQEEALNKILQNKGLTTENKIKEAEETIKKFEAEMAENGISPKTPWYIKLVLDQLEKFHLNPLK